MATLREQDLLQFKLTLVNNCAKGSATQFQLRFFIAIYDDSRLFLALQY